MQEWVVVLSTNESSTLSHKVRVKTSKAKFLYKVIYHSIQSSGPFKALYTHEECMSPPQFTSQVNTQIQGQKITFQDWSYLKEKVKLSCIVEHSVISVNSKEMHRRHFYTIQY